MIRKTIEKIIGPILCAVIMLQTVSFTYAAASPAVSSYELSASNGTKLNLITAGEKADLEVTLKDSGIKTIEVIDSSHIEAQSISGCFGTSPALSDCKVLSSASSALEYKLTFKDIIVTKMIQNGYTKTA